MACTRAIIFILTAESALAGIAALVPVGSAPELSHKRTEPQLSCRACGTYLHGLNAPGIICQFAMFQHRVDLRQTSLWTIAHCYGHGTIQQYNWRRLDSYQVVVKRNNLPPVGQSDRLRLRMNSRDRSLQCVGTEAAGLQGFL